MFPFLQGFEPRKAQRYKWEAYCRTNWRCTAVLSSRRVGVGVSEALLIFGKNAFFLLLQGFPGEKLKGNN